MSYSTKGILYDKDDNPVPQYFNAGDDTYEVVQGEDGKMFVRASEIEDTLASILAKLIAAPSTEAKQDALAALIGEVQATPTANTLLARLKSLEDKIDAIIDGTSPANVQLSGSIPEYGWLSTDDEPTPLEPTKFAMGVEINTTTHEMTTKYWNGTAWVEVL